MTTATTRTAVYRGRRYRLEFIGETKFGRRAKLGFFDGSKSFWVDASLVSVTDGTATPIHRSGGRYECEECGDYVYPGSRCWETGMTH